MDYAKVIIIDKNIKLYESSISIWATYGIQSHRVDSVEQALKELSIYKYHLIIVVMCKEQKQQALESIHLFRELTIAPIVIASSDPIDSEYCINAYDMGADEIWRMPEDIGVAVAKGNAILRRYLQLNVKLDRHSTIIVNKHIILSVAQRLVFINGNKVDLTKTEFDILALLISQPGRVYTHEQILSSVRGDEYIPNSRDVIWTQIRRLRNKLKNDSVSLEYIKTVRDVGYSFDPQYGNNLD